MKLVEPSEKYEQAYREALTEAQDDRALSNLAKPAEGQSFGQFVQMYRDRTAGKNLPPSVVPETMLWLVDNGEIIGRVSIRHELNEELFNYGGHVGYYIRPSKRGMGYGNKILELALTKARQLGLQKVLLGCDVSNTASCKIIENNGGVLERIVTDHPAHPPFRRYWIKL